MGKALANTAILELRTDIRVVAAIAVYLDSKGLGPRHSNNFKKGTLLKEALINYHDILENDGRLERIKGTNEAIKIMTELGYDTQNKGGRGNHNLTKQLAAESIVDPTPAAVSRARIDEMKDLLGAEDD